MSRTNPADRVDVYPIHTVTLREMVEKMGHVPDDAVFRWYQDSYVCERGWHCPSVTYRVTMGQVRAEIGISGR